MDGGRDNMRCSNIRCKIKPLAGMTPSKRRGEPSKSLANGAA
jgi:hypothetical protein